MSSRRRKAWPWLLLATVIAWAATAAAPSVFLRLKTLNTYRVAKYRGVGADLHGAVLAGADLREAVLCNANLRQARLAGAQLYFSNLVDADVRSADLSSADVHESNLRSAKL